MLTTIRPDSAKDSRWVTNYLDISTDYDTGLRNNDALLSQRPAYATWRGLVEL
jgi:hypothetical protein